MEPLLEFHEISKSYGNKSVLRELTFSIQPEEIVGFLGANGAGKTTALSIAVGLLHANSGTGTLLGRRFGDASARRRLGYVPHNPAFFRQSSDAAVRFAGILQEIPSTALPGRVKEALANVSMQDIATDVRKLSRGQQQRIALAQAFVSNPDLLIFDEPTAALDPSAVHQLRELLLAARAGGKGIFFSSHQLSEVERICDRILFLRNGQIQQGSLEEMRAQGDWLVLIVRGIPIGSPCWSEGLLQAQPSLEGREFVTVEISAKEQKQWMEKIWLAGGELVQMTPRRQSLESLFLTAEEDATQLDKVSKRPFSHRLRDIWR